MTCKFCGHECKKDGHQANGTQKYECKHCHRKQQEEYTYNAYSPELDEKIVLYTKEGTGIRSTARILQISATTLLKRIIHIGKRISHPPIVKHRIYEVDEIKSFIKRKQNHIWIAYALDRKSKEVVSFNIGARTNSTLSVVTETLHIAEAKRIYTDRLRNYKSLIDHSIHRTSLYGTNHIERHNLTLRTHLKRLSRKTICFSRSMAVLTAILKIYFWG
ncbi:IS1 family transposase [uncultured Alistipes sp.]|mgnify:FL=1|uniref:IS1 family transposase n=1 Tax=uncultured Alistipes sp. TaxID=538949 RepID=UPI00258CFC69|nr:IS1 family transposase [uncultured Alistipes sp.]